MRREPGETLPRNILNVCCLKPLFVMIHPTAIGSECTSAPRRQDKNTCSAEEQTQTVDLAHALLFYVAAYRVTLKALL